MSTPSCAQCALPVTAIDQFTLSATSDPRGRRGAHTMRHQPKTLFVDAAEPSAAAPAAPSAVLSTRQREMASNILRVVMEHQRLATDASCASRPCDSCMEVHRGRVMWFVARGIPVEFVLPAFPAKSPNNSKVLGATPDMAERLSLEFLCVICDRVRQIYRHGARIIVCSDGRVFSDLLQIGDSNVTRYQAELRAMIDAIGPDSLDLFNLDDEYTGYTPTTMRRVLMGRYGEDCDVLKQQVRAGGEQLTLYRGIIRFLVEDADTPDYQGSRAALQRECRERAYGVIQRSKAWGKLVAARFPDAVRLSIHPQPCSSAKLGIHLVETADNWLTPWHSTAVDVGGRFVLMKRYQAEAMGAQLVYVDGRPSHYIARDSNACLIRLRSSRTSQARQLRALARSGERP
jgi:L-tyrosine isonitrile synthase